jgi:hypothetical protein
MRGDAVLDIPGVVVDDDLLVILLLESTGARHDAVVVT